MCSLQNALLFQAELMAFGLAKVCHPSFALAGLKWLFFREQINHSSTSADVYTEEWTALPIRINENTNNTRSYYFFLKNHSVLFIQHNSTIFQYIMVSAYNFQGFLSRKSEISYKKKQKTQSQCSVGLLYQYAVYK